MSILDWIDTPCTAREVVQPAVAVARSPVEIEACHGACTWFVFGFGTVVGLALGAALTFAVLYLRIGRRPRNVLGFRRMNLEMPPGANEFGEIQ